MKSNRLLILTLIVAVSLFIVQLGFTQTAPVNYDQDYTDLREQAGQTQIQDLDLIKERAIDNIITRIRRGDPNVLRFVVYDVLAEVHRRIVQRIEASKDRQGRVTTDYYQELGNQAALHAFIGGFDNQDPKVRLRCIGFLGDWVDDIGEQLPLIGRAAHDRITSAIETREEVRYGLHLLKLKVLRKHLLNGIFNGDERVLENINPDQFVVLVQNEAFIRKIYCIDPNVRLRSIRLNPWWIDDDGFVRFRSATEEDQKRRYRQHQTERGYPPYVRKLGTESTYRNYPEDADNVNNRYGYKDRAGYLDIVSLYDTRYFRYQGDPDDDLNQFPNEERYVPAIFMGLSNPSLFVRENVARILVRLTDGPLPYDPTDPGSVTGTILEDPTIIRERPWEETNAEGQVIGVKYGVLKNMANNERYRRVLQDAWNQVKFAQFIDVHQSMDPVKQNRKLNPTDGTRTIRDTSQNHGTTDENPWGYTYNYRTDVADLMRRMGMGRHVDTCELPEDDAARPDAEGTRRYFVEDLMDLDPGVSNQLPVPDWHGKDDIRDEVFIH